MKTNIGSIDKGIRISVALLIAVLYYYGQLSGVTAIVLLSIAGIFIVTSFIGTCPIYLALGISTCNKNKKH